MNSVNLTITSDTGKRVDTSQTLQIRSSNNQVVVRRNVNLTYTDGSEFNPNDMLTFTFSDKPYTGNGNRYGNSVTYTATCKVADLVNGTAKLEFTH